MALILRINLTAWLTLGIIPAIAQLDSLALSKEYYKQGMEVFDFSHRKQATELFVMATQMDPKNAQAQLMAGESIMLTIQKEKSLEYFKRAWKLDPNVDDDIFLYLGEAYHYAEMFDSAILFYDRYNRQMARSRDIDKSNKINEVQRKIFECRNAVIFKAHPVKVTITDIGEKVNSEYPDYAPTIDANEMLMIFTTRRPGDNMNERVASDHEYYEEIFYSEKVNGEWQPAKNVGSPLNSNYHNASVNLSPDGKEMILYHDINGGDLLISTRKADGSWSEPENMFGINTEFLESSAAITQDDKTIYFTSDRPGGYGGTDIYSAQLGKNSRWTNVENLGEVVNTDMDEEGVYITANGKHLYFSSNGLAGMGDLDLYRTTYDSVKKQWGEPVNLGYPINSVENDIFFVLTADEHFAYISSLRRENLGEQDIYKIDMRNWQPNYLDAPTFAETFAEGETKTEQVAQLEKQVEQLQKKIAELQNEMKAEGKIETPAEAQIHLKWVVLDAQGQPLQDSKVRFSNQNGKALEVLNTQSAFFETTLVHHSDSSKRYELEVTYPGYFAYNSTLFFNGISAGNQTIVDTVRLKKSATNMGYVLNVYFALNEAEPLSFEGIQNLLAMMTNSPAMKVEIGGHTDSYGTDEYNAYLSKLRAERVKSYLVKGGIDENRITAVGYGESKPIAPNTSRESRKLNRRTEFIILEQ